MLEAAWYDAINHRVSRRRFTGEHLAEDVLATLRTHCETFKPDSFVSAATARASLVERAPDDLFTGLVGSYGKIAGASSAALLIGGEGGDVGVGYVGEAFALEATRLGVDTCWIAGAFSHERADSLAHVSAREHVPAIVAVGLTGEMGTGEKVTRAFVRASKRHTVEKLTAGAGVGDWPSWARSALEAARLAPSGGNAQPWRFRLESDSLVLSQVAKPYWTVKLDLGIAMLHVELGAEHAGVSGRWEMLDADADVARFTPR